MADDFQSMISENGRTQLLESNTGMHPVCKAQNGFILYEAQNQIMIIAISRQNVSEIKVNMY